MKICNGCKLSQPLENFSKHKGKKDGRASQCKNCVRAAFKKLSMSYDFRQKRKLLQKELRKDPAYREKQKEWNRTSNFKRWYGITVEHYDKIFSSQNGQCAICDKDQKDLKIRLSVDHCHRTKKVRGLLCNHCNMGIGYFKDCIKKLLRAVKYLERHSNA